MNLIIFTFHMSDKQPHGGINHRTGISIANGCLSGVFIRNGKINRNAVNNCMGKKSFGCSGCDGSKLIDDIQKAG